MILYCKALANLGIWTSATRRDPVTPAVARLPPRFSQKTPDFVEKKLIIILLENAAWTGPRRIFIKVQVNKNWCYRTDAISLNMKFWNS